MNQGRIWCVVSPTVGLPLLLGSVAVTSLIVHACVLSHTTWYGGLYAGQQGPGGSRGTEQLGRFGGVADIAGATWVFHQREPGGGNPWQGGDSVCRHRHAEPGANGAGRSTTA